MIGKWIYIPSAVLLTLSVAVSLTGCADGGVRTRWTAIKSHVQGEYYLDNAKYRDGIATFEDKRREHPDDAGVHYYLGRFYLAVENPQKASQHLARAVALDSQKADYHFWLGVAHSAVGDPLAEGRDYLAALALNPRHLQARIYLGNNLLEQGRYQAALEQFTAALEEDPRSPQALYNRALALHLLGRKDESKEAFKRYLRHYTGGYHAARAALRLNAMGDFQYRTYLIGKTTVVLPTLQFKPQQAELEPQWKTRESLTYLGSRLSNDTSMTLHILAYVKGDPHLARERAKSVKKAILEKYRRVPAARIRLSWFGVSAKIPIGRTTHTLDETVHFFAILAKDQK